MTLLKKTLATALIATGFFTGNAFAASQCATIDTSVSAAGTFPGNTCPGGKPALNTGLTPFCGGDSTPNGNGAYIFQINVGGSNSGLGFKVVSTTQGFNPEMAFMASPCDADPNGGACSIDDTNGTQTVPAAGTGSLASDKNFDSPGAVSAGTYFLIVTDLASDNPGCGAFNMTMVGTLPVKLQNFSVQ